MFFKQEHVEVILNGGKTQTRRPVKADKHGRIVQRYKVGHIYQARLNYTDDPFAYIRVTGVRQEKLADMSEADCILEGYDGKDGFRKIYTRLYKKFDENEPQWVIDFEVVPKERWIEQHYCMFDRYYELIYRSPERILLEETTGRGGRSFKIVQCLLIDKDIMVDIEESYPINTNQKITMTVPFKHLRTRRSYARGYRNAETDQLEENGYGLYGLDGR